jgi:hypothetical protein
MDEVPEAFEVVHGHLRVSLVVMGNEFLELLEFTVQHEFSLS